MLQSKEIGDMLRDMATPYRGAFETAWKAYAYHVGPGVPEDGEKALENDSGRREHMADWFGAALSPWAIEYCILRKLYHLCGKGDGLRVSVWDHADALCLAYRLRSRDGKKHLEANRDVALSRLRSLRTKGYIDGYIADGPNLRIEIWLTLDGLDRLFELAQDAGGDGFWSDPDRGYPL